ncbi:hypothetical protein NQ315_005007 [Exocentrus adspersus]|uniref:Uncharacterized protein n=1 Tax=Exocentrus adspersus TaxID=1586481 RepID=A0AAV8VQN2_9CUCU|nr:hypothetical protein NQ315_005007 [Exocentrus adspersus]
MVKMLQQGSFTIITRMNDDVNRMQKDGKTKMEIIYIELTFYQEPSPNEGLRTPVLLNNSPIIRLSNIHEQCQD